MTLIRTVRIELEREPEIWLNTELAKVEGRGNADDNMRLATKRQRLADAGRVTPDRGRERPWVSTTTRGPPGRSSSAEKDLPCANGVRMTLKKSADTWPARSCSGNAPLV